MAILDTHITTLFLIALFFYFAELSMLIIFKIILKSKIEALNSSIIFQIISSLQIQHVVLYSSIFFVILFIAKYLPVLFVLILSYQLISLMIDIFFFIKLLR